jgi:hypothetical protein
MRALAKRSGDVKTAYFSDSAMVFSEHAGFRGFPFLPEAAKLEVQIANLTENSPISLTVWPIRLAEMSWSSSNRQAWRDVRHS